MSNKCKKTELGVQPGLQINFMRYNNLGQATQLVEGVRMQTNALTATQFSITVAEQGYAVAVSELLLNASFDDCLASASRLLGRNMATYLDTSARDTLLQATSVLYGYNKWSAGSGTWPPTGATVTPLSPYDHGVPATSRDAMGGSSGPYYYTTAVVKDIVETLSTKNVPRLGRLALAPSRSDPRMQTPPYR